MSRYLRHCFALNTPLTYFLLYGILWIYAFIDEIVAAASVPLISFLFHTTLDVCFLNRIRKRNGNEFRKDTRSETFLLCLS